MPFAARVGVPEHRPTRVEARDRRVAHLELERCPGGDAGGNEVLHDLGLRVDHELSPAGQFAEVQMVAFAVELQVDPIVRQAFGVKADSEADRAQQVDRG